MKRYAMIVSALVALALTVVACGTVAIPEYDQDATAVSLARTATLEGLLTEGAIIPTNTPTITPSPTVDFEATEAAIQATSDANATVTAIAEATNAANAVATADAQATIDAMPTEIGAGDPLREQIANADVANGEELFVANNCNACHYVVEEPEGPPGVGPNQWGLFQRTIERIDDGIIDEPGPWSHIYNSIIAPNDYIVEGYFEGIMQQNYSDIISEDDLYDLVAYLSSLGE
ncbi:MAG: cytochrome c [Chloroflexota bacterium]